MESDERTREERSNPWRNKPLERPPSDEVPNRPPPVLFQLQQSGFSDVPFLERVGKLIFDVLTSPESVKSPTMTIWRQLAV